MAYPRFERHFDPSTKNVELIERDLFGKSALPQDDDAKEIIAGYHQELLGNFAALRDGQLDKKTQDKLFEKGFLFTEKSFQETAAEPRSEILEDIGKKVKEAFEIVGVHGKRDASAYSLLSTPLHEVLGFTGFVRYTEKGKNTFVPFEHITDPKSAKGFAPVLIPTLPDRTLERERYEKAISEAAHRIFLEIRSKQRSAAIRAKPPRF